jgi:hypothetical protein
MTVLSAKKKAILESMKPKRTLDQIQAEYQQVCTKAGETQYKLKCFEGELAHWNQQLLKLNNEAA